MSLAPRPQLFRRVSALAFVLALSVCLFGPDRLSGRFAPKAAAASTFTINSTGDGPDSNAADGACDDGTGHCTLRAAIQQANATPGTDTINFQIPATDPGRNATTGVFTISPASPLPTIIDPVVINGYSQPGAQANTLADADNAVLLIELNGSGVTSSNASGLKITAGGSTISGLVINRFFPVGVSAGIRLESGGGNVIQGCFIGTDTSGMVQRRNDAGIRLVNSSNNTIGGTDPSARNVVSGNLEANIRMAGSNNTIQGNFIGPDSTGTSGFTNDTNEVPNIIASIYVENTTTAQFSGNLFGGTTPGARNVITNIFITTSGNVVQGNFIGTDAKGKFRLSQGNILVLDDRFGNGQSVHPADILIGGVDAGAGNVIAGGVSLLGSSNAKVQGNLIGTDAAGTAAIGSGGINAAGTGCLVGGTTPAARNVISGNGSGANVTLANSSLPNNGVILQGNYIGTDITGSVALGGNADGVLIEGSNHLIGGTAPGAGNVISGNKTGIAFSILTAFPVGNVVKGNLIGLNAAGTAAVPNTGPGISTANSSNTIIGGTEVGASNRIAFNGGDGVNVSAAPFSVNSTGNSIRVNSIFSNGRLGINLGTDDVTPNDAGDADTGPNNLQNFPVITSVNSDASSTRVQGTLNSAPNTAYTLDFYSNQICDPSDFGEGQTFIGSTSVTTDGGGNAFFDATFSAQTANQFITATATDPSGSTSEFSACNQSGNPGKFRFESASYRVDEGAGAAQVNVIRTLGTVGTVSVNFSTDDGTARAGLDYTPVSTTLTFAPGETFKTVSIPIFDDARDEPDETVNLRLSNPTGGVPIGNPATAQLVIADNDLPQTISVNNVAVYEPTSGTATLVFTVTLSPAMNRTVQLGFSTADGTATAGADYEATSGSLLFAPFETRKTVSVTINSDASVEPNENFFLDASQFTVLGVPVQTARGMGTIVSDNSPIFEFSAANYPATEADHNKTVTVNRLGDTSNAVTVDYLTSDGSASERSDYTTALGTLRFGAGETSKTFDVLINDDAFQEPDETVNLSLVNPSAGTFTGSQGASVITIAANDSPPPASNPVDDSQFFVRQHYHDFLNREPDSPGLQFWTNQIEQCGADAACREVKRVNVSTAFFLSIEFQNTGYQVFRFYRASFTDSFTRPRALPRYREFLRDTQEIGRGVVVGQGNWEQQLQQNTTNFARAWVQRPEFVAQFPAGMTAAQFVDKLFANSGVTPSTAERDAAIAAYGAGDTDGRASALLSVTNSGSVFNRQYNPAFVLMQYVGYLRRNPDDAPDSDFNGFDFWLAKLDSFSRPGEDVRDPATAFARVQRAEMVKAFITSAEYRQRFAP